MGDRTPLDTISPRLDRLPATKTIWAMVALISFGYFFELFDLLFTGYIAPGLVKSGILTPTTPGLFGTSGVASFIAALFLGLFIGTIACGFLSDRYGRRAIFTWSLIWYSAANVMMGLQHDAFGVNLWRFVAGVGIGVESVTIDSYLTELVPKYMRGRAFAISQAIGFVSVPTAAYLSYRLIPISPLGLEGWRWIVFLGASGALVVWWLRRKLPESPRWLAQKGRVAQADAIMTRIETRVQQEYGQPLAAPGKAFAIPPRGDFKDMWVAPYRKRTIMMIIFNIFQTVGYYGWANWVPTLLIKQGITITSSLMYTSIIALAAPVGPLLSFWMADKVERKTVIVTVAFLIIVFGLAFSQTTEMAWIITLGICLTLAANIMSYTYHAYQPELFPTTIRSRAVGFVYSWSRFSAIFTGFIISYVLRNFGVSGVFVFISLSMTMVMLSIGLMGPRTKNRALEEISNV